MNITKEGDEYLQIEINKDKFWINYTEHLIEKAFLSGLDSLNNEECDHIKNKSPKIYTYLEHKDKYK